jgi:alpha-beta hydrolase superfamily lysophospholipase
MSHTGISPLISVTMAPSSSAQAPSIKTVFGVERNIEEPDFPSDEVIQSLEQMLPSGCVHGWFPSSYQPAQLHYRKWIPPSNKPKAIVIFMHGICTHSVKYIQLPHSNRKVSSPLLIERLLQNDIAFYAFDLYGHGYSEGLRSFIPESYHINCQDYSTFCQMVAQENVHQAPIVLLGESYGSTLSLLVARQFQDDAAGGLPNFDSLILTAPAIIGDLPPYPVVKFLTFLAYYYPTWRPFFMPNPVSPDRIWRDPAVRAIYSDKSLPANKVDGQGIPFRLGTGVNLLRALEDVRNRAIPGLTVPYMILHGTEDHGVPISGSELLYEKSASTEKEFLRKPGAYHDLLADPVAEECMQDILGWIEKRVAARVKK